MDFIGLYLHIPFCNGKCPYCDFYSVGDLSLTDQYTDALLNEMQMQANDTLMADTFYLGGGTPPLLGTENLIRLIQAARKQFRFSGEATLEANPNSITEAMLYRLREAGFNRISFGMQSAVSEELLALGRRHTPQQVQEAVKAAQKRGIYQHFRRFDAWYSSSDAGVCLADPFHLLWSLACSIFLLIC